MDRSPVVLITGASSGIGLDAAVELARRGAHVFGTSRQLDRAEALRKACRTAEVSVTVVQLDVRSDTSVRDAVANVVEHAGRIDVLVNNAAAFAFTPLELTSPEEVRTIVETNLLGPIRMIQEVLPTMRAQGGGRIVNVGSVSAEPKFGIPMAALYGATKGALRVLSLDLIKELLPLGIDVVLCEGGIGGRTSMFEPLHEGVAAMGSAGGAYEEVEGWARRFAAFLDENMPDPSAAGAIVADACLATRPDVRHPFSAQESLDAAHAISDEQFRELCRGDDVHGVAKSIGPAAFWWTVTRPRA